MSTPQDQALMSRHAPGSTGELLAVALPLMVSSGSQSLMQFIDRIFLSWHSQNDLAATMPAGLMMWTLLSLAFGVASYTGTFVAQYEGAGRKDRVASVVWQAIWLAVGFGAVLSLFALPAEALFSRLGHPPEVQRGEVIYFSVLMCGSPLILLMVCLSGFFSGRGQTAIVMWVNLIAVSMNIVLDYVMIFGWGPIPEMGIFGAALATQGANGVAVLLYLVLIALTARWQNYPFSSTCTFDRELAGRMVKFGMPVGTQTFVDISGFTILVFVIGSLGVTELAATNLAFNLNSLAFIPMMGLGVGLMTLVGRRVGEGNPKLAEKTVRRALILSMTYMGAWCIMYVLFPHALMIPFGMFADKQDFHQIEEIVVILLRFVAIYGLFDAIGLTYAYAVRGAGDTWYPMMIFLTTSIFCLIIPSFMIWHFLGANLYACWSAATVYVFAIGSLMWLRYRSRAWHHMRVIESEQDLAT